MTDRSKRNRGKINYTEPNESDEDIVIEQLPKPKTVKDAAVHQPPNNETAQDSAEDSDEFTLVKSKKKPKKKAKKAKKIKNVPFRFLDLPLEIRFMIYNETLVETRRDLSFVSRSEERAVCRGSFRKKTDRYNYTSWVVSRDKTKDRDRTPLQPVLLRVCKEICTTALPFLYGQKLFFESTQALHLFLARTSPANRLLIRDIVLRCWFERGNARMHLFGAFTMLASASNIQRITMDRHVMTENDDGAYRRYKRGGRSPVEFWEDIECWANALDDIRGKGTAKKTLQFETICFGSKKEIENKDKALFEREEEFKKALKFFEEAPLVAETPVADDTEEEGEDEKKEKKET